MNFTDINKELNDIISLKVKEYINRAKPAQILPNDNNIIGILETETYNYRSQKMANLFNYTNRNIICYFSAWVQKSTNNPEIAIIDNDINGFMNAIHGMDRNLGLDLLIQTPGGSVTATESIVTYLKKIFNNNIRVIVPHLAMSAGTMIACASKEIILGKESSLGPIDPQYKNVPTQGAIKEFEQAMEEITENPNKALVWKEIIRQYRPTFVGECKNIVDMSKTIVKEWLADNMFCNDTDSEIYIKKIMDELSEHQSSKVHDRHYDFEKCKELGLKVVAMEGKQELQNLILELYHSYVASAYILKPAIKFIESKDNRTFVINMVQIFGGKYGECNEK